MIISPKVLFQSSIDKVKFVEAFVNHPYGQEALLVLAGEGTPSKPNPIPGVDYADQMAASGAQSIGWHQALYALKSLAVIPVKQGQTEEAQYEDIALQNMKASGLYSDEDIARHKANLKTQPTQ